MALVVGTEPPEDRPAGPFERLTPQVGGADLERGEPEAPAPLRRQVHGEAGRGQRRSAARRWWSAAGRARARSRPPTAAWRARRAAATPPARGAAPAPGNRSSGRRPPARSAVTCPVYRTQLSREALARARAGASNEPVTISAARAGTADIDTALTLGAGSAVRRRPGRRRGAAGGAASFSRPTRVAAMAASRAVVEALADDIAPALRHLHRLRRAGHHVDPAAPARRPAGLADPLARRRHRAGGGGARWCAP